MGVQFPTHEVSTDLRQSEYKINNQKARQYICSITAAELSVTDVTMTAICLMRSA